MNASTVTLLLHAALHAERTRGIRDHRMAPTRDTAEWFGKGGFAF